MQLHDFDKSAMKIIIMRMVQWDHSKGLAGSSDHNAHSWTSFLQLWLPSCLPWGTSSTSYISSPPHLPVSWSRQPRYALLDCINKHGRAGANNLLGGALALGGTVCKKSLWVMIMKKNIRDTLDDGWRTMTCCFKMLQNIVPFHQTCCNENALLICWLLSQRNKTAG